MTTAYGVYRARYDGPDNGCTIELTLELDGRFRASTYHHRAVSPDGYQVEKETQIQYRPRHQDFEIVRRMTSPYPNVERDHIPDLGLEMVAYYLSLLALSGTPPFESFNVGEYNQFARSVGLEPLALARAVQSGQKELEARGCSPSMVTATTARPRHA